MAINESTQGAYDKKAMEEIQQLAESVDNIKNNPQKYTTGHGMSRERQDQARAEKVDKYDALKDKATEQALTEAQAKVEKLEELEPFSNKRTYRPSQEMMDARRDLAEIRATREILGERGELQEVDAVAQASQENAAAKPFSPQHPSAQQESQPTDPQLTAEPVANQLPSASFTNKVFGIGHSGADVEAIQRLAIEAGIDVGPDGPDGKFGPETERAVRELQAKLNVTVDQGVVGPEMLAAIDNQIAKGENSTVFVGSNPEQQGQPDQSNKPTLTKADNPTNAKVGDQNKVNPDNATEAAPTAATTAQPAAAKQPNIAETAEKVLDTAAQASGNPVLLAASGAVEAVKGFLGGKDQGKEAPEATNAPAPSTPNGKPKSSLDDVIEKA